MIHFNQTLLQLPGRSINLGSFGDMVKAVDILAGAIEPFPKLAETAIRCLTFYRLNIRHTCCASITVDSDELPADYGSNFNELREEDKYCVHQLNQLVTGFMSQFNESTLSLSDFINEQWVEQMDRFEAEEKNMVWTMQEKDMLLSIGVLPRDGLVDDDKSNEDSINYSDKDEDTGEDSDEELNKATEGCRRIPYSDPEYWNRQFKTIAKGGRAKDEDKWYFT